MTDYLKAMCVPFVARRIELSNKCKGDKGLVLQGWGDEYGQPNRLSYDRTSGGRQKKAVSACFANAYRNQGVICVIVRFYDNSASQEQNCRF